ncbi:MAG: sensor histidine kinase, partial [Betaproteobacteria bacterium]|nr:sensor histidine kinase [Betaproteobacteria bacterium]
EVLRHPSDPVAVGEANSFLEAANRNAGTAAIYVLDPQGLTLAASNWNTPVSFVGANLAFRPYFREAMHGQPGRFYGIGTVSDVPGLFFSQPVRRHGAIVGVVAAKVDLDKVATPWQSGPDPVLVVDDHGVVFLTSVPAWRFRSLQRLSASVRSRLEQTRQYSAAGPLQELDLRHAGEAAGAELYKLPRGVAAPAGLSGRDTYMFTRTRVPGTDWLIASLSDLRPAERSAARSGLAGVALAGLLEALGLFLVQRRRTLRERLTARQALEQAYGELETRVHVRTAALTRVNQALQREIDERQRAQEALRNTMEQLVQAGKMAALGQMATGIAHELNQPLTALHTLSDNAVVLIDKQRLEEARANLGSISRLVQRMASITGELKSFARKAPAQWQPGRCAEAVEAAVSLLRQRLQREGIDLCVLLPDEQPPVACDEVRLQQVVLNLLVNAADALQGARLRRIDITLEFDPPSASPRMARLRVADSGSGIPEHMLERLFEPFFTTKPQGVGLGLGLSIAQRIVREAGGELRARNRDGAGAEFEICLPVFEQHDS